MLLGDMFRKHGIPVHYSTIDCDDTIAAFAYHSGGSVLSRDCDFFRYYAIQYSGSPPYQASHYFKLIIVFTGDIIFLSRCILISQSQEITPVNLIYN